MSESTNAIEKRVASRLVPFDSFLGTFATEIDNAMRAWSTNPNVLSLFESNGIRMPLSEIQDKGDAYELHVEIPGIGKDNVKISAKPHLVEIVAKKSNRSSERRKGVLYTERSESSFYRQIPFPKEIATQKIKYAVKNGILHATIRKKSTAQKGGRKS